MRDAPPTADSPARLIAVVVGSLAACAVVPPSQVPGAQTSPAVSAATPTPSASARPSASVSPRRTPSPSHTSTKPSTRAQPRKPDCAKQKCIALTYNDGPQPTTKELIEVLKQEKVKATFFLMGQHVRRYPDLVRQALAAGAQIGNHSWNHPDLTALSDAAVWTQLAADHRRDQEFDRTEGDHDAAAVRGTGTPASTGCSRRRGSLVSSGSSTPWTGSTATATNSGPAC